MASGFSNQAKILRGAFVEFGISLPPLIVVFQFNPMLITRTRTATVNQPQTPGRNRASNEDFIKQIGADKLIKDLRNGQTVTVKQETLSFDIRLDATDKLNDGDIAREIFGDYDLKPEVEDTATIHDEAVTTIIQRETDIQFLKRLARRNGYECFVKS